MAVVVVVGSAFASVAFGAVVDVVVDVVVVVAVVVGAGFVVRIAGRGAADFAHHVVPGVVGLVVVDLAVVVFDLPLHLRGNRGKQEHLLHLASSFVLRQ